MRNRWFHAPIFHIPHVHPEKKVTWLELFYDLIFVAAFIQLGNGLSEYVSMSNFLGFAAIFTTMWLAWTGFTFYVNRYTVDDFVHRFIVFFQMFSVGTMAICAPDVFKGNPLGFVLSFAMAQFAISALYIRTWKQEKTGRGYSKYWGIVFGLGGLIWLFSIPFSAPVSYLFWTLGTAVIIISPFNKYSRILSEQFPIDREHLSERYGLLTIIVLGESFVKVLSSLSGSGSELNVLLQAILTLLITFCIWWIYFDDVAGSELKPGRFAPVIWLYAHLPLQMAITAVGVAIKKAMYFQLAAPVPAKYGWLLCGALALAFLATGLIDAVTERRQAELSDKARVNVRLFSGVLFLILASVSSTMAAGFFLFCVALICVSQVVFDMMSAPFESGLEDHGAVDLGDIAKGTATKPEAASKTSMNALIDKSVNKGTPAEFRKDFYFFLMEGSWTRVFATIFVLYLVINLFFAGLFTLVPGSITSVRPESFIDAFFFSVQTMSTIGYGTMSPETLYGHIIVTIEAAIGLISVAFITGVMFAKASRPRSSIIFSKPMVVTKWHGKPAIMFRVGNARGNDVVDAKATLSVLMDDLSPEGNHIRRIQDLELVRGNSPFFRLSWTIIHVIDEKSPLYGKDLNKAEEDNVLAFTIVLTGHDGTYGQTIYARYIYQPEDLAMNMNFVDVISQLQDGRLMVDYTKFHDVTPIIEESAS